MKSGHQVREKGMMRPPLLPPRSLAFSLCLHTTIILILTQDCRSMLYQLRHFKSILYSLQKQKRYRNSHKTWSASNPQRIQVSPFIDYPRHFFNGHNSFCFRYNENWGDVKTRIKQELEKMNPPSNPLEEFDLFSGSNKPLVQIKGYNDYGFLFNPNQEVRGSVIVFRDGFFSWNVKTFEELTLESLIPIWLHHPVPGTWSSFYPLV
jgi:hypothetical protein